MFYVVEFFKEKDGTCPTAVIPESWLIDEHRCYWPKKNFNPTWIHKNRKPDEDWLKCSIRILYQNENHYLCKNKEECSSFL